MIDGPGGPDNWVTCSADAITIYTVPTNAWGATPNCVTATTAKQRGHAGRPRNLYGIIAITNQKLSLRTLYVGDLWIPEETHDDFRQSLESG